MTGLHQIAFFCAVLALGACGGGGGGGDAAKPAGPDLLSGTYRYVALESTGGLTARATTARASSDGVSQLAFTQEYRASEGVVVGPIIGGLMSYVVQPGREFSLNGALGRISEDGMLAAARSPEGSPALFSLLMRERVAPTQDDLVGDWVSMTIHRGAGLGEQQSFTSTLSLDAAGMGFPSNVTSNRDGMIVPSALVGVAYTVAPDGSIENGGLRGGLSEDGRLMVLAGSVSSGIAILQVLVRTDGTPEIMPSGDYLLLGWQGVSMLPGSLFGVWRWNGATFQASQAAIVNGAFEPVIESDVQLSVSENVQMVLTTSGGAGPDYLGALGPNGAYGFFGGGLLNGDRPTLGVLIR